MSVAGATTVVGDFEPSASLPGSDVKGKIRMPTETFHMDTFRPAYNQVGQ